MVFEAWQTYTEKVEKDEESFQLEAKGSRIFVNVPGAQVLAAVELLDDGVALSAHALRQQGARRLRRRAVAAVDDASALIRFHVCQS